MPGIKRNHQDSENEEAEHEHESETERSSEESSSTSSASDSDDSSDLDEDECEKRRQEYQNDLAELEHQFSLLREQLYQERIQQVTTKLDEVKKEKASEYLSPLNELKEALEVRLDVSNIIRQYRAQSIKDECEAEIKSAESTCEDAKNHLKEHIENSVLEKIRLLEEDRHSVAINNKVWSLQYLHRLSEKTKQDSISTCDYRRSKPTTVSGPYIVYMLKDKDILEDWTKIKSALTSKRNIPFGTMSSSPRHLPENLSFNGRLV